MASPTVPAQREPNVIQSQLSFKRKRGTSEVPKTNQNINQSAGPLQCIIQNENVPFLADHQSVPTNQNIIQSAGPLQYIIQNENDPALDQQMVSTPTCFDYSTRLGDPMVQNQAQGDTIRLIVGEDGRLCFEQPNTAQFSNEVILENTDLLEQNNEFESPQVTNYQEPETLHQTLQRMESKIDANSAMLKKCLDFMMNMEKFLKQQPNENREFNSNHSTD